MSTSEEPKIVIRRKGCGNLRETRPVFSPDNKSIFVNCGEVLREFSLKTGECTQVIEVDVGILAGIILCDNDLVGVTSNGIFLIWDSKTGIQKKVIRGMVKGYDPFCIHALPKSTGASFCLCGNKTNNAELVLQFFKYPDLRVANHPLNMKVLGSWCSSKFLSIGGFDEDPIVAYIHEDRVHVSSLNGQNVLEKPIRPSKEQKWTSLRCSPTESLVAVGDSLGRVFLYRNLFAKKLVYTVYHWHTLPCQEIAFTPAGSFMYTGGGENVLVKWHLEASNLRHYLPRLQADILHIEVCNDGQLVAVTTSDNCIHIVNSSNAVLATIQDFTLMSSSRSHELFPAGLTYDFRTGSVVLNGRPGHLQFFSPLMNTVVSHVDVAQENFASRERNTEIKNTEVTQCCLSSDGLWMATFEARHVTTVSDDWRLKLWQYLPAKQCFSLNMSIEAPHSKEIHKMVFRPNKPASQNSGELNTDYVLVTVGQDQKFKVWALLLDDKRIVWNCENVGYYRYKNCHPASFCEDGSLLAVGFEETLTIWDIEEMKVISSLTFNASSKHLRHIEFGRNHCCHLVVFCTDDCMRICNLLSTSIMWTVPLSAQFLVSDPLSCFMVVVSQINSMSSNVHVFDPLSPKPLFTFNIIQGMCGAVFVPRTKPLIGAPKWLESSQLFFLTNSQEMKCLDFDVESVSLTKTKAPEQDESKSMIRKIDYLENGGKKSTNFIHFGTVGLNALSQLLKSPAHTMPSVSLLCKSLLEELTYSRKPQVSQGQNT